MILIAITAIFVCANLKYKFQGEKNEIIIYWWL